MNHCHPSVLFLTKEQQTQRNMENVIPAQLETSNRSIPVNLIPVGGKTSFNIDNILEQLPNYSNEEKDEFKRIFDIVASLSYFSTRKVNWCYLTKQPNPNAYVKFARYAENHIFESIGVCNEYYEAQNSLLKIANKHIIDICFLINNNLWASFKIKNTETDQYLTQIEGHPVKVPRSNGTVEDNWKIGNHYGTSTTEIILNYSTRKNTSYIPCRRNDGNSTKGITFEQFHEHNPTLLIEITDMSEEYTGILGEILNNYKQKFIN